VPQDTIIKTCAAFTTKIQKLKFRDKNAPAATIKLNWKIIPSTARAPKSYAIFPEAAWKSHEFKNPARARKVFCCLTFPALVDIALQ
jgi:hypothetical protein